MISNEPARPSQAPRVDHIGIAVESLEAAIPCYELLLGVPISHIETVESESVRVAFFELDGTRIELLEPTGPESAIRRFLDQGRRGVHHIALGVRPRTLETRLEELRSGGVRVLDDEPRVASGGARAGFVHPRDALGVLLELIETPNPPTDGGEA